MFSSCSSLTELNLLSFDTSSVENMEGMFKSCDKIKNINLTSFNTEKCNKFDNMFSNCDKDLTVYVKSEHCSNLIEAIKNYAKVVVE